MSVYARVREQAEIDAENRRLEARRLRCPRTARLLEEMICLTIDDGRAERVAGDEVIVLGALFDQGVDVGEGYEADLRERIEEARG